MKPIHKFNSGMGATLCNICSRIITEGMTDDLYCDKHKNIKYRKKPVEIEALQWTGQNHREMFNFLRRPFGIYAEDTEYMTAAGVNFYIDFNKIEGGLIIKTLEGEHIATIGDYIIKGVKGEYYPCKEDVFNLTYEKVL